MRKRTHRGQHRQSGQALVETALMILVIFMVVFWIFELGWLMYTYSVMANAANEGVRYAIVRSGGDPTGTQTVVKNFATTSLHDVSAMSVSVTFPDAGSTVPPSRVQVTVTYTYVPALSQFMTSPPTMHSYAEGRMVAQ